MTAPLPLLLLRLLPDLGALGRWVAATGQRALREDTGYALHAALHATLGQVAPKPFALLERPGSVQLIGYINQPLQEVQRALELGTTSDPLAALALGLTAADGLGGPLLKPMPSSWRAGESLSFEARVAPVVRSRAAGAQGVAGGNYPEIDAAFHPDFAGGEPGNRPAAHARWLARELARDGAATLLTHRALAFQLAPMARRSQRAQSDSPRALRQGLLPDLSVRGQLRVDDGPAFQRLLARGLGRHRSFGFGCLLLAPAGAWT